MEGINFSIEDKIQITEKLNDVGIQFIEGGWPGSNPKDEAYFQKIKTRKLKSEIVAFSATHLKNKLPTTDPLIQKILAAQTTYVTVFGKTWDLHTRKILNITDTEAFAMIYDTIRYLVSKKKKVIFDAEHFFDGFKSQPQFALHCLGAAVEAGAVNLTLCDTNGGTLPHEIEAIFKLVQQEITVPLGIHCHNDTGCAVANSIAAVRSGATLIQGTINGLGERTGNTDLTTLIPDLTTKLGYTTIPKQKLTELTTLSNFVYELANIRPLEHQPFVGRLAFTHKGGIHASAVAKIPESYQHIDPAVVGNLSRTTISELSGKSNVVAVAKRLGFRLQPDDEKTRAILAQVKLLENAGFYFETAEASFALLILRADPKYRRPFEVIDYLVINSHLAHRVTANIELRVGDTVRLRTMNGNGPVNALDGALRRCVSDFYPGISPVELTDYKVRILDSHSATGAKTRVLIESTDGVETWTTVGCSENIIEASFQALTDSLEYAIWRSKQGKKKSKNQLK